MRLLLLFLALTFLSCGTVSPEYQSERDYELELFHNYRLLQYYFYKPDSLKNFSAYQNMKKVDDMYASLNDTLKGNRYTRYYEPSVAEEEKDKIENSDYSYQSFGFERMLNSTEDTLIVTAVYPNSPANSAGLQKYDKLLFADTLELTGLDAKLYNNNRYRDSLFADITIFEVLRGEEIVTLSPMKKEDVKNPTVYLDSIYGVPLISVTEFTAYTNDPKGTRQEFKNALQKVKEAESAIIDMRYNLGGLISHCTGMAADLSEPDKELVYDIEHRPNDSKNPTGSVTNTRHFFARDYTDGQVGVGLNVKWVVMINEWSASCAERFVAALKSARPETILVGRTTHGKGIGQSYIGTYLDGLALITSLQTYTPDGKTFHRDGISPQFVTNEEQDYVTALEIALNLREGGALAKRAPLNIKDLPPVRKSKKTEPLMYHFINGNN